MKKVLLLTFSLMALWLHAQQWEIMYQMSGEVRLLGGCNTDEGNYIFGYCDETMHDQATTAYAMFVDNDGDSRDRTFDFEGCHSVLCRGVGLENGNAFVVGLKGGTGNYKVYDTLWIAIMTPELEIVEEHNYPVEEPYKTWTYYVYMDYNNYGEIMVLAHVSERTNEWMNTAGIDVVLKCDTSGNVLQRQYYTEGHTGGGARPTDIVRVPNSDNMMFLGRGFNHNGTHSICFIDNDLDILSVHEIPWMESGWNHVKCWKDNGHFLMSSITHLYGEGTYYAAVFEVDINGHYIDTLVYDHADFDDYTAEFGSMAYVNDDTIYVSTYHEAGNDEVQAEANILLIDSELNLLGVKTLECENMKIRIYDTRITADGGCLVYGYCKTVNGPEMVAVWKLMPEDFILPWSVNETLEVSQHHYAFPNPTSDNLNISLGADNQRVKVFISDLNGKKYFERNFENKNGLLTIDVSSLEAGIYLYESRTKNKQIQKGKFIKK